jgi:hypothetical protein
MRAKHIAALLLIAGSCLLPLHARPAVGAVDLAAPRTVQPVPNDAPATSLFLPLVGQAAPPPMAPPPQPLPPSNTDGRVAKELARRWASDDAVVANGDQQRRWTWGNAVLTSGSEPWAEAMGGTRAVWYFAKARMEITNPTANADDPLYVSSSLLVDELIGGFVQTGNTTVVNYAPANIAVIGDAPPAQTITYADLRPVATLGNENRSMPRPNAIVVEVLGKGGTITSDSRFGGYNVRLGAFNEAQAHNIAHVFTDAIPLDQLLRLAGNPLSEPFWITASIANKPTNVLIQAFERRMITYTPSNGATTRVEWGDVGKHYAQWRYGSATNITPFDPRTILDVQRAPRALNDLAPSAVQAASSRASTEGVGVFNMHTGDLFTYNGGTRFSMYSTVKFPIMLTLLDQAMRAGRQLTAEEDALVKKMIQLSDNNATSELYFRRIGGEAAVEAFLRKHGITAIDMNANYWGLSTTTAPEMARLMGKLGNCTILNRAWCDYAINVLRRVDQSQYWGVSAGVPNVYTTRTVALKNGWYPESAGWAINSVGWVKDGGKLYGIAVYTKPSSTMNNGIAAVEGISREIYAAVPPR